MINNAKLTLYCNGKKLRVQTYSLVHQRDTIFLEYQRNAKSCVSMTFKGAGRKYIRGEIISFRRYLIIKKPNFSDKFPMFNSTFIPKRQSV